MLSLGRRYFLNSFAETDRQMDGMTGWLVGWLADGHICVIMPALFQFLGENSIIKNWAGLGADSGSDFIVAVLVKLM